MEKILVVVPTEERHRALLKENAPAGAEFVFADRTGPTEEQIKEATIILGNVAPDRLRGTEKLKWIQLNSAGTDGFTAEGVLPKGCYLTNATGAYGLALSEHMLAMLFSLIKKLPLYAKDQEKHLWGDNGTVRSIYGTRTLVVGLGDIGGEFAMRMNALGSEVIGIRRNKAEKPDYLAALYQMDALSDLLPEADYVFTSLPGTKATYHIFDAAAFARMKEGAIFLNIGRGNAADNLALAEACNSGHLGGACVDVTEPEPLPADHPLWDAKNVLITPHVSGFYHLPETHERIIRIAAENLAAFRDGKEMRNLVDFETGYRMFKG